MSEPERLHVVIPSRLAVGEPFSIKVRMLGAVRPVPCEGAFCTRKPRLGGPFNLNVQRQIQFVDDVLPAWEGALTVEAEGGLDGSGTLVFNGRDQGTFPGDVRPIGVFPGYAWREPGFRFIRVRLPDCGVEVWSNPCYVTAEPPALRLAWGDPHWQTFFSDGIRCPEELYHFARHEAFLDFGAISDHMEALTDRQWDYFQAVTNDCNRPGLFATLIGQEWTHHDPAHGAPGHRNIYFRGAGGPPLRSNDPDTNSLGKLWARLDAFGRPAVAVPHHSANVMMGVDWEQGWNPAYEKAVEICSVWGSSEKPEREGNLRPIRSLGGERDGRHVRDALRRGYRFGFMGGGDVHDGRAGLALHAKSYPPREDGSEPYPQGWTAAWVPAVTREAVFDAICTHRTYAATSSRIYLDIRPEGGPWRVRAASEDGIARAVLVTPEGERVLDGGAAGRRVVEPLVDSPLPGPEDYAYVRIETTNGEMAWSSPVWGGEDGPLEEGR